MSQVKWHYEHWTKPQNESGIYFCFRKPGSDEQLTGFALGPAEQREQFLKGEPVRIRLGFCYYCRSMLFADGETGIEPSSSWELCFDAASCKEVQVEDESGDTDYEEELDPIVGTGFVCRTTQATGDLGNVSFEVDKETVVGLAQRVLTERSPESFYAFRMFSQIAPASFGDLPRLIAESHADQSASPVELADRYSPPTIDKPMLTQKELVEVLKNPEGRVSYRQLYTSLPCSMEVLRGYIVGAGMWGHTGRLRRQVFAVQELKTHLIPHLQGLKTHGEVVYKFLTLCHNAGLITRYHVAD